MTTTCPPTSMTSVTNLRGALTRLSQAGLARGDAERRCRTCAWWSELRSRLHRARARASGAAAPPPTTAGRGPPGWCSAGAAPARRGSAPNGCARWRSACRLMPTRAHRRIALVGETEHDVREVMIEGASGLLRVVAAQRAADLDRRRGAGWNGRTARSAQAFSAEDPEQPARAAVRRRLVRRARQVAPRRSDLRHAAVRPAAGRAAAPARHHDAAADPADQAADRRSAHRGDARGDAGQRRASGAGVSRRGGRRATPARGSGGRSSTARSSRTAPTRCGRAP